MKNFFTKAKDLVLYIPTLIRFLIATVKAAIYIRKQLIKQKLLSKKEADKLAYHAVEHAYFKNFYDYADSDMYGEFVYRVNTLDWIRRYGNQSYEVNTFCDLEVDFIDREIKDGDLSYKLTGADCNLLDYQISKYKELLDEINTPPSVYTTIH